jgi:hypothetical protein
MIGKNYTLEYKPAKRPTNAPRPGQVSANEEVSRILAGLTSSRQLRRIVRNVRDQAMTGDINWVRLFLGLLPRDATAAAAKEAFNRQRRIESNERRMRSLRAKMRESEAA